MLGESLLENPEFVFQTMDLGISTVSPLSPAFGAIINDGSMSFPLEFISSEAMILSPGLTIIPFEIPIINAPIYGL